MNLMKNGIAARRRAERTARCMAMAVCIAILAGKTASAALVLNGTFESPVQTQKSVPSGNSTLLTSWKATLGGIQFGSVFGNGPSASGSQSVQLANGGLQQGGITQTIATVPGESYTISVDASDLLSTSATGSFAFGSQSYTLNPGGQNWQTFTWTETAGSSSTILNITGWPSSSGSDALLIDNVSVTIVSATSTWVGGAAGHATEWGTAANWNPSTIVPDGGATVSFGSQVGNSVVQPRRDDADRGPDRLRERDGHDDRQHERRVSRAGRGALRVRFRGVDFRRRRSRDQRRSETQ